MTLTSELIDRLESHYIRPRSGGMPGGIFAREVGVNGSESTRRCDAVYVGFTSSSGRVMIGHEVKVSRADWGHELDQPSKADDWHDACHEWWVVAPSTAIVDPQTLPAGWGLLVPSPRSKTRMVPVVPAERRDVHPPWWAVRSVMARYDTLVAGLIAARVKDAYDDAQQKYQQWVSQQRGQALVQNPEAAHALRLVEAFRAAGINLNVYSGRGVDEIGPDDLTALAPLIRQTRDIDKLHTALTSRWHGASKIAEIAADLRDAVNALTRPETHPQLSAVRGSATLELTGTNGNRSAR